MRGSDPHKTPLLIVTYQLADGGVEEIVRLYAANLNREKYAVTVSCFVAGAMFKRIESLPHITVAHINTSSRILRFVRLYRLATKTGAQIVHDHSTWYGLIIGRLVGAKTIETIHNRFEWFNWHEKIRFGLYCLLAHRVVAVAESVKRFSLETFPFLKQDAVVVVRNAVDVQRFRVTSADETLRSELGIAAGEVVIGFVGRLAEQKGVRYLLSAATQLSQRFQHLRFVIVGVGDLENELKAQCGQLGLSNVIFAGFQNDTPRYYSIFDVFVLPSLFEGMPVSVLEAMAASLPVVATDVSGTGEVVVDDVTGYLVLPRSVEQLEEKLAILIANREKRVAMGRAGRKRVEDSFSAGRMVTETEQLYEEVHRP